ncbi:MAG: hypothetical protein ACRD4K_10835, partial [Candidatus Acidiferrales bacterium]
GSEVAAMSPDPAAALVDVESPHNEASAVPSEAAAEIKMSAAAGAGRGQDQSTVVNREEEPESSADEVTESQEGAPFPPSS